jgi:hypothetical protein
MLMRMKGGIIARNDTKIVEGKAYMILDFLKKRPWA